jgi:hypothetical protein
MVDMVDLVVSLQPLCPSHGRDANPGKYMWRARWEILFGGNCNSDGTDMELI